MLDIVWVRSTPPEPERIPFGACLSYTKASKSMHYYVRDPVLIYCFLFRTSKLSINEIQSCSSFSSVIDWKQGTRSSTLSLRNIYLINSEIRHKKQIVLFINLTTICSVVFTSRLMSMISILSNSFIITQTWPTKFISTFQTSYMITPRCFLYSRGAFRTFFTILRNPRFCSLMFRIFSSIISRLKASWNNSI